MSNSKEEYSEALVSISLKLAVALRRTLSAGYSLKIFGADLMAGLIVGMIAIPLGMSLAISTGLPPQSGFTL